jgi:hypothetical protein
MGPASTVLGRPRSYRRAQEARSNSRPVGPAGQPRISRTSMAEFGPPDQKRIDGSGSSSPLRSARQGGNPSLPRVAAGAHLGSQQADREVAERMRRPWRPRGWLWRGGWSSGASTPSATASTGAR